MSQTQEKPAAKAAVPTQAIRSLLVHAEPGAASTHRVKVAARLARDNGARLIGLGAEAFEPMLTVDPFFGYAAAEWATLVQEQIVTSLKNAEAAFERDAAGADTEWRSIEDKPARALAHAARAADIVIMGPKGKGGSSRTADPAEVIMTSGRPVLIVPDGATQLHGKAVIVAWKDTREARRAVADAMPFLVAAETVIVQVICDEAEFDSATRQADDVVDSLKRHGVKAKSNVTTATNGEVTMILERTAVANHADLIVAGAYGHNRTSEWVFGGVTDDLLHRPECFVLLSH